MFLGGGAWFSVKIFGENFWNLFFRSRCRTSWSNVTILGLHLVLRSTMRKMEGFCEIHVFRGGGDFRSKFQELLFCRSRCCISWSNFIIFSFWLAIWWIMSNIKGFCEIYIFRGGRTQFSDKISEIIFLHERLHFWIKVQHFLLFTNALGWIMREIEAFCKIHVLGGGRG